VYQTLIHSPVPAGKMVRPAPRRSPNTRVSTWLDIMYMIWWFLKTRRVTVYNMCRKIQRMFRFRTQAMMCVDCSIEWTALIINSHRTRVFILARLGFFLVGFSRRIAIARIASAYDFDQYQGHGRIRALPGTTGRRLSVCLQTLIIITTMMAMLMTMIVITMAPGSNDARLPQHGLLLITTSDTGPVSIGHYRGF